MFVRDGIVYGGEPEKPIKIVDVKVLPDMMLLLRFNNEELRLFDAALLEGPVFEPLHDEKVFSKPVIDHGVITWLNGAIDCAPEYMYEHSYPQSREFAAPPPHNVKRKSLTLKDFILPRHWEFQQTSPGYEH